MNALDKMLASVGAALEKKAYDLVVLRIEHLTSIADYFVMMSARSSVQVMAIAQGIEERLQSEGERPLSIEGRDAARWVVLDYNDVVLHIFLEPVRELYRLESIWSDAANVALPEPLRSQAERLSLRDD